MWEADGSPDGMSDEYWFRAEKFVNERSASASVTVKNGKSKPSAIDPATIVGGD
jgi:hypothetical protein